MNEQEIDQLRAQLAAATQRADPSKDPEMAWDDDLGWLHKNSLEMVRELRTAKENADAACAEMRELLTVVQHQVLPGLSLPAKYTVWFASALSSDCGKSHASAKADLREALGALAKALSALEMEGVEAPELQQILHRLSGV